MDKQDNLELQEEQELVQMEPEQEAQVTENFSLEDIMKEFGGEEAAPSAPVTDETVCFEPIQDPQPEETGDDTIVLPVEQLEQETEKTDEQVLSAETIELPVEQIRQAQEGVTDETVRFTLEPEDLPEESSVTEETVAFDTEAVLEAVAQQEESVTADTIRMEPLGDGDEELPEAPAEEPEQKEEPFSEQWEPEYEQPMGEYVPPQPIIFHPRSRLRELKRKLVEGPEKRYYELIGLGLGKLQVGIFFGLLVVLVSVGVAALMPLNLVPQERQQLMVFGQLFLMLIAALLGSSQLVDGVADLFKGRFSLRTLLVFTFLACIADAVICLNTLRVPCCAAFSLEMLMCVWSAYHKRNTEMGMMDTMRKAIRLDKISVVEDYYDGKKGFVRGEGQVEDFTETYNERSQPEKIFGWYALGALVASVAVAITAIVMHGITAGVQMLAVSLLAAVPATAFISQTRPLAVLERRLHRMGAVLCGWKGVSAAKGKAVFPVDHNDLFPTGASKMNGVKFFGNREPDEIVAYCTALVSADGGGLAPLFNQVLDSRNGRHYDVENLQAYPNGGLGGEVCGESVLVGVISFLREMGVEIPEGMRVNQAVCVAIEGELCGLFAVTYEKTNAAAAGLATLCSYSRLKTILTNGDFMLTPGFLRSKFGVKPKRIIMPNHEVCQQLQQIKAGEDAPALVLSTKEGLAPFAYGITGARALRTASWLGLWVHLLGGIVGIGLMVALTIMPDGLSMITPMNMFLYQLVWAIPGILITEWTRSI